jgi:hypothetical protein
MWFRIFLVCLGLAAWALARWFWMHTSSDPVVLGRWSAGYFALVVAVASVALLLTIAHAPPIYRRLLRVRVRLFAAFVSVVATLALLEGLVRLTDPLGISYYAVSKDYNRDKVYDPDLVYRNPSSVRKSYGGIEFDFNDLGMRERPIGPKADGEFRLLFVGDSVVFGSGVPIDVAFVRRVETLLAKRMGRPVRTINSGVGSYNTRQECGSLLRNGEKVDPDFVLLIYVDNDHEPPKPDFNPDELSPPETIKVLLGRFWLYRLVVHVQMHSGGADAGPPPRGSPEWRESMENLAKIADYCRAHDVPFAAMLWRYGSSPLTDALWEDLSAVSAAKGFPLGDMKPAFDGADLRAVTISPVDAHPNAEGHRRAAERIEAFLAPLLTH